MSKRKIKMVVLMLALALILSACGNTSIFNGSKTGDENCFDIEFSILNTSYTHDMELAAGDSVDVEIESNAGNISLMIQKDDEDPVYEGNHLPSSSFRVGIDDEGTYTLTVTGDKASGHVVFTKIHEYDSVDVIEKFFDAFAEADYETMRQYCTKECQDFFFHDGDVDGMVWAKLLSIDEDNYLDGTQNKYVEVEAEFCPESALYGGGDSITGFYVVLVKGENGEWLVDSFPTG